MLCLVSMAMPGMVQAYSLSVVNDIVLDMCFFRLKACSLSGSKYLVLLLSYVV